MLEALLEVDRTFFILLNQKWQQPWLDVIMPLWRTKTTWLPLYALLLLVIVKDYKWKTFWALVLIGASIALADQTSSIWIKNSVQRLRPCRDPLLVDQVRILVHCGTGFSFTSSHACNHFALATQLFLLFRHQWKMRYWLLWFAWAASIAYGQVYVGVHYPLDVMAGALLGIVLASVVHGLGNLLGVVQRLRAT